MKPLKRKYRCNLCRKVVTRVSNKLWIRSICERHGNVIARLYRVRGPEA